MYSQVLKPAGLTPRPEKRVPDPNKNGESSKPVPTVRITNNFLLCACSVGHLVHTTVTPLAHATLLV